jgi:hypothetical protein
MIAVREMIVSDCCEWTWLLTIAVKEHDCCEGTWLLVIVVKEHDC